MGAWLFEQGSYVYVFGTSMVFYAIGTFGMIIRLWGYKENLKISKKKMSPLELFHYRHIVDTFKVVFRPRKGHKRTYLIFMMICMLTSMMPYLGKNAFEFLYTKRFFSWDVSDYSLYQTVCTITQTAGMVIFFPLLHYLHASDNITIFLAVISNLGANLFKAFSFQPWMFFAAAGSSSIVSLLTSYSRYR